MDSLNVSIHARKGIYAVVLLSNGTLLDKYIGRIKSSDIAESGIRSSIYVLEQSFVYVRKILNENKSFKDVIFEINNTTLAKWMDSCCARDEYQDEFIQMMELLFKLPIRYTVVVNLKPMASYYSHAKYLSPTLTMSGLNLSDYEEDVEEDEDNVSSNSEEVIEEV